MGIADSAIPPELPPVSALSPVPLRRSVERFETMAGDVDRAAASPGTNRAS